jgi:hypothetical protein
MKLRPCKCGSKEFIIGYKERGYQDLNDAGETGADGYDIREHELYTDDVYCRGCNEKQTLTGPEMDMIQDKN